MELFWKLWFLFSLSLSAYSQIMELLEMSVQVFDIIDAIESNDQNSLTNVDAVNVIMKELSEKIETSETNILRSIVFQSRLDRIDDAVIQIKNSLQDLRNYLNASSSTRDSFKTIFITNYENGETSLIRFLPTLLTYKNPGRQDTLLSLLAADTRCNLTAIDRFKTFYYKLMSSGIGINVAYTCLKFDMSREAILKEWSKTSKDIEAKFQKIENYCYSLFTTYAKQDLTEAVSAHALHIKNNAWNPWKKNDVFFSKSYGTYQFVYFEYEDDTVIWQKTDSNDKVAVFYHPYLYENRLSSNILTDSTERFRSAIDGEDDDTAAKHVAQSVQKMLKQDGYVIESLIILFDDGDSEEVLDIDSPAVKATMDNVKLSYCYENRARCTIDVANVWDSTKTASGSFKIYVYAHYPNATIQHSIHHVGAADSLANISVVLFLAASVLTTLTIW